MADCSKFDILYQNHLNTFNAINGSVDSTKSDGMSKAARLDIAGAEAAVRQLDNYSRQLGTLISEIAKLEYAADDAGCTGQADKFLSLLNRAEDLESKVGEAEADVNDAITDAEDKKQEAEDAAAQKKQDELDSLEEVSVTGKKTPEKIDPKTDPGAADQLTEVSVTGKKTPEKVTAESDPTAAAIEEKNKKIAEAEAKGPDTIKNTNSGLPGQTKNTRAQATLQDTTNFKQRKDWRVRLALSPGAQQAKYLYYSDTPGILEPLQATDGVIFPYTPTINVTYGATYNSVMPVHSNYKIFQYESSTVDSISITCDFTAQDTAEANYILAVIHFFRSVTKMFYGQDEFPKPGTPPPLCYLFGLGEFQFNAHPLAITNFTYNLPPDVDYIRAGALTESPGQSRAPSGDPKKPKKTNPFQAVAERLAQNAVSKLGGTAQSILKKVTPGGKLAGPDFNGSQNGGSFNSTVPPGTKDPTYVPTKINISISAVPIVSRYDISNRFSVKDYASGKLLNGVKQAGGGIW
jgi:hypothetical protein